MATQFQIELLQQALGLNYDVSPTRNLFCAGARSDLDRQWNALCLEGLAFSCGGRLEKDGYNYYRASERGIELAKDNRHEQQPDGA